MSGYESYKQQQEDSEIPIEASEDPTCSVQQWVEAVQMALAFERNELIDTVILPEIYEGEEYKERMRTKKLKIVRDTLTILEILGPLAKKGDVQRLLLELTVSDLRSAQGEQKDEIRDLIESIVPQGIDFIDLFLSYYSGYTDEQE